MRRGIAIAVALGAVVLIAGCTPKFNGPIKGKQLSDSKVQVKFKVCVRELGTDECGPPPEPKPRARGDEAYRHLLAFRVPKGTGTQRSFKSKVNEFRYTRSGSYARELKRLAPTPGGTKWYGYMSEQLVGEELSSRDRYKLKFGLPDDPGERFKYRPVTGYAFGPAGDFAVDCGDDAFDPSEESNPNGVCISDPTTRREVRRSLKIKLD